MRRFLIRACFGPGLLGAALAAGCSHSERDCSVCCGGNRAVAGEAPALPRGGVTPSTYRVVAAAPALPVTLAARAAPPAPARPLAELLPARYTTFAASQVEEAPLPGPPSLDPLPADGPARKGRGADGRTFTDITAHPAFAHAPDYRWVVGVLQHDRGAWSIRYASVDEEDRHGGTLLLVNPGPLALEFHPGQLVRIEGEMVDPAPHQIQPGYRPRTVQPLLRH